MSFSSLQDMREEAGLSKGKLETDDTNVPKKLKFQVISKDKCK